MHDLDLVRSLHRSHTMGFSYVIPKYLAQGSVPTQGSPLHAMFDSVVLCAEEHQDIALPGIEVIHAPFDDSGHGPTPAEVQIAWRAARRVVRRLRTGKRVLVTCAMGWNRSGLVVGFVLITLGLAPAQAIDVIRMARGPTALSNKHFVRLLSAMPRRPVVAHEARV